MICSQQLNQKHALNVFGTSEKIRVIVGKLTRFSTQFKSIANLPVGRINNICWKKKINQIVIFDLLCRSIISLLKPVTCCVARDCWGLEVQISWLDPGRRRGLYPKFSSNNLLFWHNHDLLKISLGGCRKTFDYLLTHDLKI